MSEQKVTLKELIQDIDFRLSHLEDITADNRKIMVKLVKQGNTIVEFLKQFDVEEVTPEELGLPELPPLPNDLEERADRIQSMKEMVDEFIDKHEELKEFEKELKKHKEKLTPGQMGES